MLDQATRQSSTPELRNAVDQIMKVSRVPARSTYFGKRGKAGGINRVVITFTVRKPLERSASNHGQQEFIVVSQMTEGELAFEHAKGLGLDRQKVSLEEAIGISSSYVPSV